jgi:hypothetical protein
MKLFFCAYQSDYGRTAMMVGAFVQFDFARFEVVDA